MPIPLNRMNPTERFSNRVESYRRYRPHYPAAILNLLERECGLSSEIQIADIAAGTGLLTELFLENGNSVFAVEPNAPMRAACSSLIAQYPRLSCIDSTAEATKLATHSVDMITVGQAMHWFDLGRSRAEWTRILRPGGWCVIFYNHRRMRGDDFHSGYEHILSEFGKDYQAVQGQHLHDEKLADFFAPAQMQQTSLPNVQELTLEGLTGRILSSSYMPRRGDPGYPKLLQEIEALFARFQTGGQVRMEYECVVSYGKL